MIVTSTPSAVLGVPYDQIVLSWQIKTREWNTFKIKNDWSIVASCNLRNFNTESSDSCRVRESRLINRKWYACLELLLSSNCILWYIYDKQNHFVWCHLHICLICGEENQNRNKWVRSLTNVSLISYLCSRSQLVNIETRKMTMRTFWSSITLQSKMHKLFAVHRCSTITTTSG